MQINTQMLNQRMNMIDTPLEIKQGEIYSAQIKERLSQKEAVLQIRGKETFVQFEDSVPTSDKVTVQITGQQGQYTTVKTVSSDEISSAASKDTSESRLFESLGITSKDSSDLKQAVRTLFNKDVPLSKEAIHELRAFFEEGEGTTGEKLSTVKALANKGLEVTQIHLRSIHEALHGKPLNEVLASIAKELDPDFEAVSESKIQTLETERKLADRMQTNANVVKQSANNLSTQQEALKVDHTLSKHVASIREKVEQEPDLQKAIQTVKREVINHPKIDAKLSKQIEKAATDAQKLQNIGKDRLVQALKSAEEQLTVKEQQQMKQVSSSKIEQATIQPEDKDVETLVKELKTEVHDNPNLRKSIEKVQNELLKNDNLPDEIKGKVEKALQEANTLLRQGRVTTGREVLSNSLSKIEKDFQQLSVQSQNHSESLQNENETRASEVVRAIKESVQNEPSLQRAVEQVRDQIVNNPKVNKEVSQKIEQAVRESVQLEKIGRESVGRERLVQALTEAENELSQIENRNQTYEKTPVQKQTGEQREIVKAVKEKVQSEPRLQRAVEQVREQIVNNPKVNKEVSQKIEQALRETVQLERMGRETVGRDRLVQALTEAENELSQIENRNQTYEKIPVQKQTGDQRASEIVKAVKEKVQNEPRLQRAVEQVRDQIVNNSKVDREVSEKIEQALREAVQLERMGRETVGRDRLVQALTEAENELSQIENRNQTYEKTPVQKQAGEQREIVKAVKESVQNEPRLQRAVEQVREQIVNNPKVDREVSQKIEQVLRETVQLERMGRETVGRDRLVQALTEAENELSQIENRNRSLETTTTQKQPVEQQSSEIVKAVKERVQSEPRLQRAMEQVREQIVNNPKIDREVSQKIEQALREAVQLERMGRETVGRDRLVQALTEAENELTQMENRNQTSETTTQKQTTGQQASEIVKEVREKVQSESRLQKAVEQVREQIVNNPKVDREVSQKVEQVLRETVQLERMGRETVGRDRLVQALTEAENELSQIENRNQTYEKTPVQKQTREQRASEVIKTVRESIQRESRLQRAIEQIRDQIINNKNVDREIAKKLDVTLREAVQLQHLGRNSLAKDRLIRGLEKAETEQANIEDIEQQQSKTNQQQTLKDSIQQVRQEVQNEQDIKQSLQKVFEQISNIKNVDPELARNIEKAAKQAKQLDEAGRDRLSKMLRQAEASIKQEEISEARKAQNNTAKEISQIDTLKQNTIDSQKQTNQFEQTAQTLKNDKQTNEIIKTNEQNFTRQVNEVPSEQQSIKTENQTNQIQNTQTKQTQPSKSLKQLMLNETNNQEELSALEGNKPSETILKTLKLFQSEPDLEQALNLVRKEISSNPNISMEHLEKIGQVLERAQKFYDRGREIAARQHVTKELNELQQTMAKTEPQPSNQSTQDSETPYDINEMLQSLQIQSKDILVTRVTQKLAEVTYEFRGLKREIARNLDNLQRLIDTYKRAAYPQAKQMLETTISKLDNAILKSDIMLFTDMKTEKQLLQASSQLAEAKKLLAKGEYTPASKIVGQIKELMERINFKPTEQKIVHYVKQDSLFLDSQSKTRQMQTTLETAARGFSLSEPSAREMFEVIRSTGLNHDSELANDLVFKQQNQSNQDQTQQQQNNMKAVLLKMMAEESGTKVAQQAEQALNNLTGQQLLSKSDTSGTMQSMFFNLPMFLGGKPENLQIYINSKNEGQQIDWENCSLYFLIETKKLGDVGIMLSSTDRNLSITIKNDKPGFKEKMEPLAEIAKERLHEIGYNVGSISFARMTSVEKTKTETNQQTTEQSMQRPFFTEKGMDFRI